MTSLKLCSVTKGTSYISTPFGIDISVPFGSENEDTSKEHMWNNRKALFQNIKQIKWWRPRKIKYILFGFCKNGKGIVTLHKQIFLLLIWTLNWKLKNKIAFNIVTEVTRKSKQNNECNWEKHFT